METREQYRACRELGFDLFQGFHFARPVTVSGNAVDPARAALLELLRRLRQGAELDRLEELLKQHASLGLNLLRLVNSVGMARSQRISTVRQSLVLIGRRRLERWLVMLLFAGSDPAGAASPLLQVAAMRGRLMELLAGRGGEGRDVGERAFLAGMLSLVDAVLGLSKLEVMDQLHVDEGIRLAVLERREALGRLLALAEAVERADFARVEEPLRELALDPGDLFQAGLDAAAWVGRLEAGAAAPTDA